MCKLGESYFEGVVATWNGMYWGTQRADGLSTSKGWGPIENAEICEPEHCKKPEDMTYKESPYIKDLAKSVLVKIRKTTSYQVIPE